MNRKNSYYVLFSKSGFTEAVLNEAKSDDSILLVDLAELMKFQSVKANRIPLKNIGLQDNLVSVDSLLIGLTPSQQEDIAGVVSYMVQNMKQQLFAESAVECYTESNYEESGGGEGHADSDCRG